MSLKAKIHSLKHFLLYAATSKTKYKVHSPFVFRFIQDVLEPSQRSKTSLPHKVINYYIKTEKQVSLINNAGEGSIAITKKEVPLKNFINKVSIPPKYGEVLAQLCAYYQIEEVIELGTSLGVSAAYLGNNANIQLSTVEANKSIYLKAKNVFESLEVHNVSFINAKFDEVLLKLIKKSNGKRLIFIDGDHNKDACIRYFKTCLEYVDHDTIIVFDDIYWSEGMSEAWYDISRSNRVSLSIDLYRMGILFFRNEQLHQEHFRLWY